jgi:hypothetical protein
MMRIRRIWFALGIVVLMVGCDSEIVDVDDMTNGRSLVGTWTLDSDSTFNGSLKLRIVEEYIEATAWFEDSVYKADGQYMAAPTTYSSRQGWGYLFLGSYITACEGDCREFYFKGEVHPSKEMMRGWLMVRERKTWVVIFSDSITSIKQK